MPGINALKLFSVSSEKDAFKNVSVKNSVLSVLRLLLGPYTGYPFLILPNIILIGNIIWAWASVGYQKYHSFKKRQLMEVTFGNSTLDEPAEIEKGFLEMLYLKDLGLHFAVIGLVSLAIYPTISAYIYYQYEVKQRANAKDWKLQPDKFLSPELFVQGIWDAAKGLAVVIFVHSFATCYVFNDGPLSKVYFNHSEHSILWSLLQLPVLIAYQDYIAYWYHRFYHIPVLYKIFHKYHHKYKSPTIFLALAVQPLELTHFFANFLYPAFVIPVYFPTFLVAVAYMLHTPFVDHTGHNHDAPWWQPWKVAPVYHDEHHRLGWGNFGYHTAYIDQLLGTGVRYPPKQKQSPQTELKSESKES